MAPSDAREQNRNIGAQLQSILYTSDQKQFWKIYLLYDIWCGQTCIFRAVFGPPMRNLTLATCNVAIFDRNFRILWRHLQTDLRNVYCFTKCIWSRCTTTIHPVYKCSKENSENLLPVGLLVRTNLYIPSRFWTTNTEFDTCCQRHVATCGKFFYIGAHLQSRP